MRIVFVGAGAVGGYFGARMAGAGLDVAFLVRPRSAPGLKAAGIRVRSPEGDIDLPHPIVLDGSPSRSPADVLFFACKAEQVPAAAALAGPLAGPRTLAVPLQNGVDAPDALIGEFGAERVLGGLSRIFAERTAPGRILHASLRPSIACGEYRNGRSARVDRLVEVLAQVPGLSIAASDDIWTEMWQKLLMVCALGAVGAAVRAPLGVLLDVPEARRILERAAAEIAAVGRAHGADIPEEFPRTMIGRYRHLPPDTTASMHRDLVRGDPSELNEQLGAAIRHGGRAGLATPTLDALYGALLPGELRARGQLQFEALPPRGA